MFDRYAVYYTPQGALAKLGAAWLGWDSMTGNAVAHPKIDNLELAHLTQAPRKYGMHGTLKAPFYLAENTDQDALAQAVATLA
ncbi:MAG: hypothetical protein AAF755_07640 [Pseudomonadota bacterium]